MKNDLSADYVRSILDYDPNTGVVTWIDTHRQGIKAGSIAGTYNEKAGYVYVSIDVSKYCLHRIIWLWMTGVWPEDQIDHIDTCGRNNKWDNLREANNSQNNSNRFATELNTSGFKGVSWHKSRGKWRGVLTKNGRSIHIGHFDDPRKAAEAYANAAKKYHGEFARTDAATMERADMLT